MPGGKDILGERYQVNEKTLGEGAFGAVMLGIDLKDPKRTKYAIKKVPIDNMVLPRYLAALFPPRVASRRPPATVTKCKPRVDSCCVRTVSLAGAGRDPAAHQERNPNHAGHPTPEHCQSPGRLLLGAQPLPRPGARRGR
jgi:hypothetical protein